MEQPAYAMFISLDAVERIRELISNGEAEGPHLECKSPSSPQLTRDLKVKLAEAASGFANAGGGVILWGVSTTKHAHSELDVLSQIEPIGNCRKLSQEIDRALPMITYPSLRAPPSRVLTESTGDTRGVVVTYIPPTPSDPVQSVLDRAFYIRNGDEFSVMPYEILKRMFAGVASPDLRPVFHDRLVTLGADGTWRIPILLENGASAAATNTTITVEITNPGACENITPEVMRDTSSVNPGKCMFSAEYAGAIHRGLNQVVGHLYVQMKKGSRSKRILTLEITVYSSGMRARKWTMRIQLAKKGFSVRRASDTYLY